MASAYAGNGHILNSHSEVGHIGQVLVSYLQKHNRTAVDTFPQLRVCRYNGKKRTEKSSAPNGEAYPNEKCLLNALKLLLNLILLIEK